MSSRNVRSRLRRSACVVLAAALTLGACASMPTRGPVHEGTQAVSDPAPVFPQGYGPVPDALPEDIVRGFLSASAGSVGQSGVYAIAREYLTAEANDTWDPSEKVLVFAAEARPVVDDEATEIAPLPGTATVRYTFPVAATVDSDGRFTEAGPGESVPAVYDLEKNAAGQWRIRALPTGLLLSRPNFDLLYRPTPIYFLSADLTHLVPEVRWFSRLNTVTYAAHALLTSGPSPWLRDGVVSAVPEGTDLAQEVVEVDSTGVALVALEGPVAALPGARKSLFLAQLEATLAPLPRVRDVEVTANGLPLETSATIGLVRDPIPQGKLLALTEDGLAEVIDKVVTPIESVVVPDGVDSIAQGADGVPLVGLRGDTQLVDVRAGESAPLHTGTALLQPSVDRFGWVWTGEQANTGELVIAATGGAQPISVPATWLEGNEVRSIRVSRDGARIAVVSVSDGVVTVDVAAVGRDDVGTPQRVGDPVRVGSPLLDVSEVAWVDESTLAVLGISGTQTTAGLHLVPLAGVTVALTPFPGGAAPIALAAGKGDRSLYIVTPDGQLMNLQTAGWVDVASGVVDVVFPG